jgi:hypothetical protein
MEFSEVRLSYSLFTNTNKITKIANKNKIAYILFLTTQLRTKIKLSLNIRLRIMESLLKSATEAFRYKEYSCVRWDRSLAKFSPPPMCSSNWPAEHFTRGWKNMQTLE